MRPLKKKPIGSGDLFRSQLDQIINMRHELVQLADEIDWAWVDDQLADLYHGNGRPAVPPRFMVGLLFLKHIYGLSDEGVCERWVHDPYFQCFTGEAFFQQDLPHERSGMSHWHKRIGERLDLLLAETLRVADDTGALPRRDLARVTVDTTVQPKNVTFPTDAKLMLTAVEQLGKLSKERDVPLRQSYARVAKQAAMMAGRYAHAKQFKRYNRNLKFLRTRLGRLIRDIGRKVEGDAALAKRPSPSRSQGPARSAPRNSASAAGSSIPGTRRRPSASARARSTSPTSSAARCRSPPPTAAARAASSCSMPRRSTAIRTTATPSEP